MPECKDLPLKFLRQFYSNKTICTCKAGPPAARGARFCAGNQGSKKLPARGRKLPDYPGAAKPWQKVPVTPAARQSSSSGTSQGTAREQLQNRLKNPVKEHKKNEIVPWRTRRSKGTGDDRTEAGSRERRPDRTGRCGQKPGIRMKEGREIRKRDRRAWKCRQNPEMSTEMTNE